MWQRIVVLSAAAAALLQAHCLWAQPPVSPAAGHRRVGAAVNPGVHAGLTGEFHSLWTKTDWVRLEIVGGRLAVQSTRCGECRLVDQSGEVAARQSLEMRIQPASLVVNYALLVDDVQVTLDVDRRGQVTLGRAGGNKARSPAVRYTQPADGAIALEVGTSPSVKYSAPSLWHLLIAEPEVCRDHLLPLFAQLRPDWRIDEQVEQIEAALRAQSLTDVVVRRQQWQTWVDQLAAERFGDRQAADASLRGAGQTVLAFLRQLDQGLLDREQQRRIRSILADVTDPGADSSERVASWLVDDKHIWLALLSRGDLDQRIAAASHLTKLCRRSLGFDPEASDALRQAQLAQVREMLAENR